MAWSFVGVGNSTTVTSGNITLVEPSGVASGDLLVACIAYRSNATFTVPGDWNLVATQQSSGNTSTTTSSSIGSGLMMWTVRGGSAPTLTISRTAGDVAMASVVAYRGHRASPYDTGSANTLGANSATATTGTITTAEANALIVAMAAGADNVTWSAFDAATDPTTASGSTDTSTAPTAGTWIERRDGGSNSGADTSIAIADAVRATAGATGTIQATASASSRHVMIAAAFLPRDDVSQSGETLTATPVLVDGVASVDNPGTAASELLLETGTDFLLQEDGSYLQLDSTGTNVTVDGEILTATPVLVDGAASIDNPGTGADEILLETGTDFLLQEDGSYIRIDTASGDVSVTGETLTATPTLVDGTATGTAEVTGETQTATPTLIDGTATGTASVTGETLTATPTLVDGTATGDANVDGETLTVSPVLLDGSVSADGNIDVAGETLTATPVLVDGTATGDASVTGETLVVSVVLLDGEVTIVGEAAPANVKRGGDDAPRSHVGIPPKLVKDKKRRKQIERDELEELYNRIHGIEPQTKVAQKALAAVQKAVAPSASELPPAETLDWARIENDLKAAIAIRRAYRIIQDEEDAVIALLLAA